MSRTGSSEPGDSKKSWPSWEAASGETELPLAAEALLAPTCWDCLGICAVGQFRHYSRMQSVQMMALSWHEPLNVPASARRGIQDTSLSCCCYQCSSKHVISLWTIERLKQQQEAEISSLKTYSKATPLVKDARTRDAMRANASLVVVV